MSEITAPRHYILTPSISVPQEMNVSETTIKANSTPQANFLAGLTAADHPGHYVDAAEYLALGRKQLGPSGWETDKPLSLQLYCEGASLAYRTGDTSTMDVLLDEVLSRPDLTVMEKFRAYEIKIIARQSADQFHESLTLGLDVLKQLGLPVLKDNPRSKVSIVMEYVKTKRALGKRTAEELASLPQLTDERIGMGLRISELLLVSCYQAQPTMFALLAFRMVRATLKHGINISSGDALISYGIILCGAFREPKRGREMAKAGELILEKYEFKKSRATLGADGLIYYWTAPLLDTELDIESYFLAVKKLRGVEIQEDERDFDGILAVASEIGNQSLLGNIYLIQLDLKVFSGEWEEAAKMLESAGNVQDALFAKFSGVRWTILEALISIRATRFSKKMLISLKWRRRAYKSVKRVRGWAKKKNPKIEHSLHLLEAELASSKGKKRKAISHYRDAIETAEDNGFLQDQALSNELASLYFDSIGDTTQKSIHMENAIRCYSEWELRPRSSSCELGRLVPTRVRKSI